MNGSELADARCVLDRVSFPFGQHQTGTRDSRLGPLGDSLSQVLGLNATISVEYGALSILIRTSDPGCSSLMVKRGVKRWQVSSLA